MKKRCFERHNKYYNIMIYSARCLQDRNHMTKQTMWMLFKKKKIEKKKQTWVKYFPFYSTVFQIIWIPYVCNLSIMTFSHMYIKLRDHYIILVLYNNLAQFVHIYLLIWLHVYVASRALQLSVRAVVRI